MLHAKRNALAATLAVVLLGGAGCTGDPGATSTAYRSLPAMHGQLTSSAPELTIQWPHSVPAFGVGNLIVATASGPGVAIALWETTVPAQRALDRYHVRLLMRGFQPASSRAVGSWDVRDYDDGTIQVRVIAHPRGTRTELTVAVRPL